MSAASDPRTRRAFLAECGSALLLSTTTYSAAVSATQRLADADNWPSPPVMASIASGGVTAGDQILAIGCLMPAHQRGVQRALISVGTTKKKQHVTVVPTEAPPLSITPLSSSKLLVVDDEQAVTLFDFRGGHWKREMRRVFPVRPEWNYAALCGQRIVVAADFRLSAIDLEPDRVAWMREDLAPSCLVSASPRRAICALSGGEIVAISAATGQTERLVCRCHDEVVQMAVDPDGELLACLTRYGGIEVHSLRDGRRLWIQREHGAVALPTWQRPKLCGPALSFSPNGADVVTVASEGEWVLATWDARTGERLQTLRGHDDQINGAGYLSDGTLVSWSSDSTLRWWDAYRGVARRTVSIREFLTC